MNQPCPRCGTPREGSTRFCTSCGADLGNPGQAAPSTWYPSQQAPNQAQAQAQVPSWASAAPGLGASPQGWNAQGNSSSASQNAFLKKAAVIIIAVIAGALVLLLLLGIMAALFPALRCVFLIAIAVIILVPWLIYVNIRSYIRRTFGQLERGLWWSLFS